MAIKFDYEGALKAGYSEDEISSYLKQENPDYDYEGAVKSGYSPGEVNMFLSGIEEQKEQPERSLLEKGGRIAAQYGLGAIEGSPLGIAYNLSVAPLSSKTNNEFVMRGHIGEEIEDLYEKNAGKPIEEWPQADQDFYNYMADQIKPGGELKDVPEPIDISIKGLAEKATGIDLNPEGIEEKAAQWAGFIKDPKKLFELAKTGFKTLDIVKAIAPTGKEAMRGLGAGIALQMAEEGNFGPIGTMAAAVVGDISGGFGSAAAKGTKRLITEPKKVLAEVASKFTSKDKINLQKEIIKDFQDSGIQADLGTLTDNNIVKWTQARLAQSGLTGKGLDELKNNLTNQIKNEYKAVAESLGEARFATTHEAGQVAKEGIKKIRDADLAETRQLYKAANESLGKSAYVDSRKLGNEILAIEKELQPGSIKSTEQQAVLDVIEKLKRDLFDSTGRPMFANVKDLINNKVALNDIINYEVQGGAKQLLKKFVGDLDRAIISHGKENPGFARKYIQANKRFADHAKSFRNKSVSQILKTEDPAQLMNKMNSVQGIRDLRTVLSKTPEGKAAFDGLARLKLDQVIGNNFVDSITEQVKQGTFSKLLEKGKNREIFREILSPKDFKRLERLQKNSGRLAETAQKFFNSSKSGVTVFDVMVVGNIFRDLSNFLIGNPWGLIEKGVRIEGTRRLAKLISDPTFLKLVEETIIASENNNIGLMQKLGKKIEELSRPLLSTQFSSKPSN